MKQKPVIVKTGQFNILKSGSNVTIDTLIHERIVNEAEVKGRGVKILADGKLTKRVTVEGIPMSEGAKKELESVIEPINKITKQPRKTTKRRTRTSRKVKLLKTR